MTPEQEQYEYERMVQEDKERQYYEMLAYLEEQTYNRNACVRCGMQREDWHNKLCGDEFCAKCSMYMDQFELAKTCQPVAGDPSYGQKVQTQSQVSAPSQRRHAPASQRKATGELTQEGTCTIPPPTPTTK